MLKSRFGRIILNLVALMLPMTLDRALATGLDRLCFKNGMVHGLLNLDQNSLRYASGDLYGLEDTAGRVIIPAKFSDIEYCGHGLFLATETEPSSNYYFGTKRSIFNREGVELAYKLPAGAVLLNIFSFGKEADRDKGFVLDKLPDDMTVGRQIKLPVATV